MVLLKQNYKYGNKWNERGQPNIFHYLEKCYTAATASNSRHLIRIALKQQKNPIGHSGIFATQDEFLLIFFFLDHEALFAFKCTSLKLHGFFLKPPITVPPLSFNSVFAHAHVENSVFCLLCFSSFVSSFKFF